jgi:hypothetical protein
MNIPNQEEEKLKQAIQQLASVRQQQKSLKKLEDDAKYIIKGALGLMQKDSFVSDTHVVSLNTITTKRLDVNAVKAHLGTSVNQFMKETQTTRVEVKGV